MVTTVKWATAVTGRVHRICADMTKKQLEKEVQKKLAEAKLKLDEAAELIDSYYKANPTADVAFYFLDKLYCPRNMKYDADEAYNGNAKLGIYMGYGGQPGDNERAQSYYDDAFAGEWLSSNTYRGC